MGAGSPKWPIGPCGQTRGEVLVTSSLWQSRPSEVLGTIRMDHSKGEEWPDGGASAV